MVVQYDDLDVTTHRINLCRKYHYGRSRVIYDKD